MYTNGIIKMMSQKDRSMLLKKIHEVKGGYKKGEKGGLPQAYRDYVKDFDAVQQRVRQNCPADKKVLANFKNYRRTYGIPINHDLPCYSAAEFKDLRKQNKKNKKEKIKQARIAKGVLPKHKLNQAEKDCMKQCRLQHYVPMVEQAAAQVAQAVAEQAAEAVAQGIVGGMCSCMDPYCGDY
ncbi:MAG TPA: hypothetical protein VN703_00250 [Candidatus Sulfopaludibacter sp.]|nr:hypothetical protein [Candidatus Sulfopaludibacter sp.]